MALNIARNSVSRVIRSYTYMSLRASSDGSIREMGGKLKDKEMADENQYFRRESAQQLKEIKEHHNIEIQVIEDEMERLKKKKEAHLAKLKNIEKK